MTTIMNFFHLASFIALDNRNPETVRLVDQMADILMGRMDADVATVDEKGHNFVGSNRRLA